MLSPTGRPVHHANSSEQSAICANHDAGNIYAERCNGNGARLNADQNGGASVVAAAAANSDSNSDNGNGNDDDDWRCGNILSGIGQCRGDSNFRLTPRLCNYSGRAASSSPVERNFGA